MAIYWEKIDKRVFPVLLIGESHTIPALSSYTVRLHEVPFDETPSTVSITEDGGAGVFTETTGTPGDWEFVVNYDNGIVSFNGNQANMAILVDYKGTGSFVFNEDINDLQDDVTLNNSHRISDGSDHSFIDQSVVSGASPTFNGINISGIISGDVDQLHFTARKGTVGTITKGKPVYITGYNASGWALVEEADASNPTKMPAAGIAELNLTDSVTGFVSMQGRLTGQVTDIYSIHDSLWVASGGGLTDTKPTGTNLIQKVAEVMESDISAGILMVFGAGRTNDVPNIASNNFWLGNGSSVATPVNFDTEVSANSDVINNTAHSAIVSGNPHVVTKSEIGLGSVPNLDTTNAVNNEHTHSNKVQLDLVTDGDHDVSNGASHSEVVDNTTHRGLSNNPHTVTKAQLSLDNVTNDAQLKRADGDFNSFTGEPSPATDDLVLIEDQSASYAKKKVLLSDLHANLPKPISEYDNVVTVGGTNGQYTNLQTAIGDLASDNTLILLFPKIWTVTSTINSTMSNGYNINIMAMSSYIGASATPETIISANMDSAYIFDTTGIDIKIFNCKLQNLASTTPPEGKIAAGSGIIYLTRCHSEGSFGTRINAIDSTFDAHVGSGEGIIDQSNIARSDFIRCAISIKIDCNDTSAVLRFLSFTDCRMNHSIDLNDTIYQRRIFSYGNNYISNIINVNATSTSAIWIYGVLSAGSVYDGDLVIDKNQGAGLYLQKLASDMDANGKYIQNVASPALGTDAANRNYVDAQVGGNPISSYDNVITVGGTKGEYTDLNAAITAAGANDVILVFTGTWTLSTTITKAGKMSILGMGGTPADVIITKASGWRFSPSATSDWYFQNLKIDGDSIDDTNGQVQFYHCDINKISKSGGGTIDLFKCDVGTYTMNGSSAIIKDSYFSTSFRIVAGTIDLWNINVDDTGNLGDTPTLNIRSDCFFNSFDIASGGIINLYNGASLNYDNRVAAGFPTVNHLGEGKILKIAQNMDANSKQINNLGTTTNPNDAATKAYVDGFGHPIGSFDKILTVGGTNGEYTDLWSAIVAASSGDTILLFPGTWDIGANEINQSKNITIVGIGSREDITIDADVYVLNTNAAFKYIFENITINSGNGIRVTGTVTELILRNCIVNNSIIGNQYIDIYDSVITGQIYAAYSASQLNITNSKVDNLRLTGGTCTLKQVDIVTKIWPSSTGQTVKVYGRTYVAEYNANVTSNLHIYGQIILGVNGLTGTQSPTITRYGGVITKLAQDMNANGKKITSLGAATTAGDAVRYEQLLSGYDNILTVGGTNGEYTDLKLAMDAAGDNDIILVFPGTWTLGASSYSISARTVNILGMGAKPDDVIITSGNTISITIGATGILNVNNCYFNNGNYNVKLQSNTAVAYYNHCKITGYILNTGGLITLDHSEYNGPQLINQTEVPYTFAKLIVHHSTITGSIYIATNSITDIYFSYINKITKQIGTAAAVVNILGNTIIKIFDVDSGQTVNIENGAILSYESRVAAGYPTVNINGEGQILKLAQNMDANSKKITNLAAATVNGDAVRFEQILFGQNYQIAVDETGASTTSITYVPLLTLTTPSLPAGDYHIAVTYEITGNKTNATVNTQVQIDNAALIPTIHEYAKKPLQASGEWISISIFYKATLTAAVHTIDLDYKSSDGTIQATIRRTRIEIWRLS